MFFGIGMILIGFGLGFVVGHIFGVAWATQELMRLRNGGKNAAKT